MTDIGDAFTAVRKRWREQIQNNPSANTVPTKYANLPGFSKPAKDVVYAELIFLPSPAEQVEFGGATNLFRTHVQARAFLRVGVDQGTDGFEALVPTILTAFRQNTIEGVTYLSPHSLPGRVEKDAAEYILPVVIPFYFEEFE